MRQVGGGHEGIRGADQSEHLGLELAVDIDVLGGDGMPEREE